MSVSAFCPHNMLPNLTHLALPFLDLGNDFKRESALRLPPGVLAHRALRMLVLTVDEDKWLRNPWYEIARYSGSDAGAGAHGALSPRATFRGLERKARAADARAHLVLSPRSGAGVCAEWAATARGGESLWEVAARCRAEDSHGAGLPDTYPKTMRR